MNTKPTLFDCILSSSIVPYTNYLDALGTADRYAQLTQLLTGADASDDCEAESSVRLAILQHYKTFLCAPARLDAAVIHVEADYDHLLAQVLPSMQYAAATCGIASRVLTKTFYAKDYQGCVKFIAQLHSKHHIADLFHLQDALLNAIQVVNVGEDAEATAFEVNASIARFVQDVPTVLDPRYNLIPSYADVRLLGDYFFSADSTMPFNLLPDPDAAVENTIKLFVNQRDGAGLAAYVDYILHELRNAPDPLASGEVATCFLVLVLLSYYRLLASGDELDGVVTRQLALLSVGLLARRPVRPLL